MATRKGKRTCHASEPLLPGRVPQLQAHLDAVDMDLLRDKKCAGGGGGVLGLELVLGVAVQQTGLADTCGTQT